MILLCIDKDNIHTGSKKEYTHVYFTAVCMYVCIAITYSKNMDQPGKVDNPARGQLKRKNNCFPVHVRA